LILFFFGNLDVLDFFGRIHAFVFEIRTFDEAFVDGAQVLFYDGFLK